MKEHGVPGCQLRAGHADGAGGRHGIERAVGNLPVAGASFIFKKAIALSASFEGFQLGSVEGNGAHFQGGNEIFLDKIFPGGAACPADNNAGQCIHHVLVLHFVAEGLIGLQVTEHVYHLFFRIPGKTGIPGKLMAGQAAAMAEHIADCEMGTGIGIIHSELGNDFLNRIVKTEQALVTENGDSGRCKGFGTGTDGIQGICVCGHLAIHIFKAGRNRFIDSVPIIGNADGGNLITRYQFLRFLLD
ncbi:hypothetical protein HMPREF1548_06992 [Clostridium sp. KLE 1755]|nr:hypothetical protein HMPREF1548_06992 [Clostridium sp. KLE 1755]